MPFTLYNLFDYYCAQGPRDMQSLPYLFANLDSRDFKAVTKFSECFGLLGTSPFLEKATSEISNTKEFRCESSTIDVEERISQNTEHLILQLQMARFTFTQTRSVYLGLFQRAQEKIHKILSRIENAGSRADARNLLPKHLTKWGRMRPELAWDKRNNCWATLWHLPSLESGIYLMLHIDLQRGGLIRSCQREDCSKWFRANHPVITFCSSRCQNTHSIRQYRVRKKDGIMSPKRSERR